jgi:hypothetical protein
VAGGVAALRDEERSGLKNGLNPDLDFGFDGLSFNELFFQWAPSRPNALLG